MRWQSPSDDDYPAKPTVKRVAFEDIRDNLPSSHPSVTPEQRAAVLQERYEAVNKRRNPTAQFDTQTSTQASGSGSGCSVGEQGQSGWALVVLMLGIVRRSRTRPR